MCWLVRGLLFTNSPVMRDQSVFRGAMFCSEKMSLHAVLDTYVAEFTEQAEEQTLNWLRRHQLLTIGDRFAPATSP